MEQEIKYTKDGYIFQWKTVEGDKLALTATKKRSILSISVFKVVVSSNEIIAITQSALKGPGTFGLLLEDLFKNKEGTSVNLEVSNFSIYFDIIGSKWKFSFTCTSTTI